MLPVTVVDDEGVSVSLGLRVTVDEGDCVADWLALRLCDGELVELGDGIAVDDSDDVPDKEAL